MSDDKSRPEERFPDISGPVFQAMRAISTAANPQELVDALQQHILPDTDTILLIQIDSDPAAEPVTEVKAAWPQEQEHPQDEALEAICRIAQQQRVIIPDVTHLDDASPLKSCAQEPLQAASLAIFPLAGRERTLGYLVLAGRAPHPYGERELELLDVLAGQIATVLENIILLDTLGQHTAFRERLIDDITARLQRSVGVDDVLETTVHSLHSMLQDYDITLRLSPQAGDAARRLATDTQPEEDGGDKPS
jgi:GAF domain-containing protein